MSVIKINAWLCTFLISLSFLHSLQQHWRHGPEGTRGAHSNTVWGLLIPYFPLANNNIWSSILRVSRHKTYLAVTHISRGVSGRQWFFISNTLTHYNSISPHFTHFLLYSSLSRLTLASTLYRALSSGVIVSIWTPTPSGCVHVTPGPCRVSNRSPCLRTWVKLQMVPGSRDSGPSVCTATSRA